MSARKAPDFAGQRAAQGALDIVAAFVGPHVRPVAVAVSPFEIVDLEQPLAHGVHVFDHAVGADHADAIATGLDDAEEVGPRAFQNAFVRSLARHQGLLAWTHVHRLTRQFKSCV
jgi:hypothetical protein